MKSTVRFGGGHADSNRVCGWICESIGFRKNQGVGAGPVGIHGVPVLARQGIRLYQGLPVEIFRNHHEKRFVGIFAAQCMQPLGIFRCEAHENTVIGIAGKNHRIIVGEKLGQPIIIENRPGAGATIGTTLVAKAPLLLLVANDFPAKSLKDLVALAKAQPGKLNYASIGNGSPSHLGMEMFKRQAAIDMLHVPYKGSGPALIDVMAGHVPIMMDSVVSASPHVKAGKLRALAVTTATRLPSLPDVPTIAELGLPGFDVFTWTMLYVPAGTPAGTIVIRVP